MELYSLITVGFENMWNSLGSPSNRRRARTRWETRVSSLLSRVPELRPHVQIVFNLDNNQIDYRVNIHGYMTLVDSWYLESLTSERDEIRRLEEEAGHKLPHLKEHLLKRIASRRPGKLSSYCGWTKLCIKNQELFFRNFFCKLGLTA